MGDLLKTLLIAGIVITIIGAICRELLCWFWKINLQVSLLQDISKKLDALAGAETISSGPTRTKASSLQDPTGEQVVCVSCGSSTSTAGEFCEQCGRRWRGTSS